MGIYKYTLRAPTKTVGGIEIAQLKYGWKAGSHEANRYTTRLTNAAWDNSDALTKRGVRHFVVGSRWSYTEAPNGIAVYRAPGELPGIIVEEPREAPRVGTLRKVKGRFVLDIIPTEKLLAEHYPEIGILQTEDGPRYYHTLYGSESRFSDPYSAMSSVKVARLRSH